MESKKQVNCYMHLMQIFFSRTGSEILIEREVPRPLTSKSVTAIALPLRLPPFSAHPDHSVTNPTAKNSLTKLEISWALVAAPPNSKDWWSSIFLEICSLLNKQWSVPTSLVHARIG